MKQQKQETKPKRAKQPTSNCKGHTASTAVLSLSRVQWLHNLFIRKWVQLFWRYLGILRSVHTLCHTDKLSQMRQDNPQHPSTAPPTPSSFTFMYQKQWVIVRVTFLRNIMIKSNNLCGYLKKNLSVFRSTGPSDLVFYWVCLTTRGERILWLHCLNSGI